MWLIDDVNGADRCGTKPVVDRKNYAGALYRTDLLITTRP